MGLNFGVFGSGAVFNLCHGPALSNIKNVKIKSIFDVDKSRAKEAADKWKIDNVVSEHDDIINDDEIDAVIIATPNNLHHELTIKSANKKKHIFCEKPISINLQEANEMIVACDENKVQLQIGFNQRFWSQVQIVKRLLDMNFIGKIHSFRTIYSEKYSVFPAATPYRYILDQSGGATIIDLAIHRIDMIRYLLGEYKSLVAELKHSEIPAKVDDNVHILLNMENGAVGTIASDRYSPAIGDGTDLYGSEGAIHFNTETINPFHAVPLAVYTEKPLSEIPDFLKNNYYPDAWWKEFKGGWITVKPERTNPYQKELQGFCDNISSNKNVFVNGTDGLKALEVVFASYISKNERRWVDFPIPKNTPLNIPRYS